MGDIGRHDRDILVRNALFIVRNSLGNCGTGHQHAAEQCANGTKQGNFVHEKLLWINLGLIRLSPPNMCILRPWTILVSLVPQGPAMARPLAGSVPRPALRPRGNDTGKWF